MIPQIVSLLTRIKIEFKKVRQKGCFILARFTNIGKYVIHILAQHDKKMTDHSFKA